MLYRKIPKSGDTLSILGFGCMRLPVGKDGAVDEARAIKQMRYAIDNGVNYMDTAWNYLGGESENILGRTLADGYRQKVRIATKLPQWKVQCRQDMDRFLDEQLVKLGVERIDYYLLHAIDGCAWDRLTKLDVIDFMDRALADGRIGNAGFSFHGIIEDFYRIVDGYDWSFCQIQYNFLDQENQAGTAGLNYAAAKNLGIIVMEPLRGGNLTQPTLPPAIKELWESAPTPRTPVEWALRWVWNHPAVTVVLSGMNEEAHIEENLAIAGQAHPQSLTEAELSLVDKVAEKYSELMKVGCTGCSYCMPCPEGVKIPACFEMYNNKYTFQSEDKAKWAYAVLLSGELTGNSGYASQCVECRECVDKCPQNIEIPEMLAQVAEELEDDGLVQRVETALQVKNED